MAMVGLRRAGGAFDVPNSECVVSNIEYGMGK